MASSVQRSHDESSTDVSLPFAEWRAINELSQASSIGDHYLVGLSRRSTCEVLMLEGKMQHETDAIPETALPEQEAGTIPKSVYVLYLVAFLSHWTQTLTEFITWFVIEARSWSNAEDTSYYGLVFGIFLFGPVIMNPTVGYLSDYFRIKSVIVGAHVLAAFGLAVMLFAHDKISYALGAFMYACLAVRPLRTTYIAMVTTPLVRTRAMAYLNLFTDGSKLLGVMTAKSISQLAPSLPSYWVSGYGLLSYQDLCLLAALALLVLNTLMILVFFKDETARSDRTKVSKTKVSWSRDIKVVEENGKESYFNGHLFALMITVYFCSIGFLHQVSYGLVNVSNFPVLTYVFGLEEDSIANIKLCQDLIPAPSPMLVALLSNFMADRSIFISGILLAIVGIGIFAAPLGSAMTWFQPLVGMVCMSVSQQFFYTADFSIFSKVLGPRATGIRMASMASASALGATAGAAIGGKVSEHLYGSPWFYALTLPSVVALLMMLNPWFFRIIAPGSPVVAQIVEQWQADEAAALIDGESMQMNTTQDDGSASGREDVGETPPKISPHETLLV